MVLSIQEAANVWAAEHQGAVRYATVLINEGLHPAFFSSLRAYIGALALGIERQYAKPADSDMLIPTGEFDRAAEILGAQVEYDKLFRFTTGTGEEMRFRADRACGMVDGDEIEFMRPLGGVLVGSRRYNTTFTELGVAARHLIQTEWGVVPLASDTETVSMYALGQRDGKKDDARRTIVVLASGDAVHDIRRIDEIGWDEPIKNFVAGCLAVASEMRQSRWAVAA